MKITFEQMKFAGGFFKG